ncbi:MAG TPA: NADH-ubiquinone oxidoreductase-F iron-sulfur binding region domain-containing protein [Polyangiaceae bacterium]|nr:NADH-ubiquinone oxidoreductase-F iron-sulfur binding region domain-containing protein [Polyangiaceae bacterium]
MTPDHWLIPETPYESYDEYLDHTGENAVEKAYQRSPDDVLEEVHRAGLRGRGGAGFPAGIKWRTLKNHPSTTRFVTCNAAEGEPGTFKDRFLLRRNPYPVLEGMLIAAHVIGAQALYIGIKASFTRELARLRRAVVELSTAGLIRDVDVHIVEGPDEYLFGEEKALMEVLEGGEPMPREAHRPPYEVGLFATPASPNPALANNVETYAHVPSILRHGADSFRKLGTPDTPGTLIFTVSGAVKKPGVYEREAGITLRELFYDVAGGPLDGRAFKAAMSGVSARVIPADKFDIAADFASLQLIGAGLGSAGFILYDDRTSMPRVAQAVARFLYVESCNQCTACKHGLRVASDALNEIFDPRKASADDLPRALFGARSAPQGNRCYLPVQGSVVIPSFADRFKEEFDEQIANPGAATEPVLIPKFVDFIEETGTFVLDERLPRKRPDWTYDEPVAEATAPSIPRTRPAPADLDRAPVAVRLSPDLVAALTAEAERSGQPIDKVVNEALRTWLKGIER